jgi:hypothetical protein
MGKYDDLLVEAYPDTTTVIPKKGKYADLLDDNGMAAPSLDDMSAVEQPKESMFEALSRQAGGLYKRMGERAEATQKPTVLGNAVEDVTGSNFLGQAAAVPERALRMGGQIAGNVVDIPFTGAGQLATMAGKMVPQGVKDTGKKAAGGLLGLMQPEKLKDLVNALVSPEERKALVEGYKKLPESAKLDINSAANIAGVLPVGKGAKVSTETLSELVSKINLPQVVEKVVTAPGAVIENVGKSALRSGMKIKDVTAKKVSKNVTTGAQKIIDDIAKYKVQSTIGGFSGISKNAQKEINAAKSAADNIIEVAAKDPTKNIDIDKVMLEFIDDIELGKIDAIQFDEIDKSVQTVYDLSDAIKKYKAVSGSVPLDVANDIKRSLGRGAFKKGAPSISDDATKMKVKELLDLRFRDEIQTQVPEIAQHNKKIHELINVKAAADEADKRMKNWNVLTMTDLVLGGAGGGAAAIANSPETAIGTAALMLSNRLLRGGKGASAAISAGQALKMPIVARMGAGGVVGGGVGATQGDTPEERQRNAMIGGLAGMGVGAGPELLRLARGLGQRGSVGGKINKLYHGTSSPEFDKFSGDVVYLTKSKPDAESFANNDIIGGGRGKGNRRVINVDAPEGKTKNIDELVQTEVMEGGDLDVLIKEQAELARKDGYDYLSFSHPSTNPDAGDFEAIVAINPKRLNIANSLGNERGAVGGGKTVYHHSDKVIKDFSEVPTGTWFTTNKSNYNRRPNATVVNSATIPDGLKLADKRVATELGLYRGDPQVFADNLRKSGYDGLKMTVDGDVQYMILDKKNIRGSSPLPMLGLVGAGAGGALAGGLAAERAAGKRKQPVSGGGGSAIRDTFADNDNMLKLLRGMSNSDLEKIVNILEGK